MRRFRFAQEINDHQNGDTIYGYGPWLREPLVFRGFARVERERKIIFSNHWYKALQKKFDEGLAV